MALPPLPKIEGDVELLLDVFTHNSLRMSSAPMNEDYGNADRLAELGASVLRLVVATHFFRSKDSDNQLLSVDELQKKTEEYLQDDRIDEWMNVYGLKAKLRIAPSEMKEALNDIKQMRKVFETYIGALYIRNQMKTIQSWISKLIDPNHVDPEAPLSYTPPPSSSGYGVHSSPPAPPSARAPPMPPPPITPYGNMMAGMPGGSSGQVLNVVSTALLNQRATQAGFNVTYHPEHSGPPHQPTWTVRCCLNGIEYGRGTGKTQKAAKDEACKRAWAALRW